MDINEILNTPDTTAEYDANDIENNKVMAILAYIGILVLAPIFLAKDSKFSKFHANQGLILLIVGILAGVVSALVFWIPVVGTIVSSLVSVATLLLMVLGIVNAAQGKAKELPFIGQFKLLK